MNKINIAYITKEDSLDKSQWSGTSNNIYHCLKKTNFKILRIGSLDIKYEKLLKIYEFILKIFRIKYDPDRNIKLSKLLSIEILKRLKNKKVDLIFVHGCPLISFLDIKIPIVIWTDLTFDLYQKTYFKKYKKYYLKSYYQGNLLENLSLNKAEKIIYSTQYAANNAIKKYRVPKKKINIIPFGFDIDPLSKKEFAEAQKKRVKMMKVELRFLTVGVDWDRKNMEKNILVIEKLNKLNIKSSLTIIGTKPPKNFLVPKYVNIVPFLNKKNPYELNKLKNYYLKSHFFIILSKAEAFGLVVKEACAYGLPIIANNIDGLKYVASKEFSILVKKNDKVFNIANKIFLLNKSIQTYKKLSKHSYNSSLENNWNSATLKIEKMIKKIIQKKNKK